MIIKKNPALSSWNSQNLTPSPPIWDLLLALSPIILPAVYGILSVIRAKEKAILSNGDLDNISDSHGIYTFEFAEKILNWALHPRHHSGN